MENVISKIMKLANIHSDSNQKWILISLFLSGLLMTYAHPTLFKTIVSELPAEWLAFDSLSCSICGLLIGMIWKGKLRVKVIRYFLIFAIAESLCGCLLGLYLTFIKFDVWVYAIASLIYCNVVSLFVGKCIMTFKAKLWIEKEREIYDNNTSIVSGIVCVIGYVCAIVALPSLKLSLFLWAICCIIDDIGWIIVYKKNENLLKNI